MVVVVALLLAKYLQAWWSVSEFCLGVVRSQLTKNRIVD